MTNRNNAVCVCACKEHFWLVVVPNPNDTCYLKLMCFVTPLMNLQDGGWGICLKPG